MPSSYFLERARFEGLRLSFYDVAVVSAIVGLTITAWSIMIHTMSPQAMSVMSNAGPTLDTAVAHLPMWTAMAIGMMLPLATVTLLGSSHDISGRTHPLAGLCFASGYLSACLLLAVCAALLEVLFHSWSWRFASAAGLCVVGLYQFTPTKLKALSMCKGDLFRSRVASQITLPKDLRSGFFHAAGCFRSCGLAMFAPIFFGANNVGVMAALFVWMALEQAGWISAATTRVLGAGWLLFAFVIAVQMASGA